MSEFLFDFLHDFYNVVCIMHTSIVYFSPYSSELNVCFLNEPHFSSFLPICSYYFFFFF